MKPILIHYLFLGLLVFAGRTQATSVGRCESLFMPRTQDAITQDRDSSILCSDLARMYVEIQAEENPSRRIHLQRLFDESLPLVKEQLGSRFGKEFQMQLEIAAENLRNQIAVQESLTKAAKEQMQVANLTSMTRLNVHPVSGKVFKVVDDHRIIFLEEGNVKVYDYKLQKVLHEHQSDSIFFLQTALYAADRGKMFFFTFKKIGIFDINSGELSWQPLPPRLLMRGEMAIVRTALSRDGDLIYIGSEDGDFIALDSRDLSKVIYRDRSDKPIKGIIESPDGRYVIGLRHYGADRLYRRNNRDFSQIGRITKDGGSLEQAMFTPDSLKIVLEKESDQVYLFDITSGKISPHSFAEYEGRRWSQVTADHRYLFSINLDAKVRTLSVVDLTSFTPVSVGLELLPIREVSVPYYDATLNTLYFWSHDRSANNVPTRSQLVTVFFDGLTSTSQPMAPQNETRITGVDPASGHLFQTQLGKSQTLLERY